MSFGVTRGRPGSDQELRFSGVRCRQVAGDIDDERAIETLGEA